MSTRKCDGCKGKRLKESSMHVKIDAENIGDLCSKNIEDALTIF
jgi:excinuclease ABC subunit A